MKDLISENHEHSAPPVGFIKTANGISILNESDEEQWLCSPLRVIAMGALPNKSGWGYLVEVTDPSGMTHLVCVPMKITASKSASLLQEVGLRLNPSVKSATRRLHALITSWDVRSDYRFLDNLGWCDCEFETFAVSPVEIIGSKPAFFVGATSRQSISRTEGSLEHWKATVAALCVDNQMLTLAVSVALAGPFVRLLGINSFVVHLRGSSSSGKTTALLAANSVWSSAKGIKTWRTTANALESVAASANDTFLALDEIGEVSGADAYDAAYMLGNGMGKQRARSQGGLQDAASWSLSCLSTGEISLAEKIAETGKGIKTGQEVRFIDVEADGRQFGLFDCLHDTGNGSEFSAKVKEVASQNYGTAGHRLIEMLCRTDHAKKAAIKKAFESHFGRLVTGANAALDGPSERVARNLALVATAGEVSTLLKITGWEKGAAGSAAKEVFDQWLACRQMPIIQACTELTRYLTPRMNRLERLSAGPSIADRVGYIDDDFFYLPPICLSRVIQEQLLSSTKQLFVDQKVLIKQGNHFGTKMPGAVPKRERHYKICRKKLAEFSRLDAND